MARRVTTYRCTACGAAAARWAGRCPGCGAWNALEAREDGPGRAGGGAGPVAGPVAVPLAEIDPDGCRPASTGVAELDRVLSGGLLAGSVTLLYGEPGVGKSTLLLQVLAAVARRGRPVLLVSAEESARQVRHRAERLGPLPAQLMVLATAGVEEVEEAVAALDPALVVVDSVQTLVARDVPGVPGSVGQVRACVDRLARTAKALGTATVLVGHVTKDGAPAGPRALEHLVDTVVAFEGDRHHSLRLLRAVKHRFGTTGEVGLFELGSSGLVEVADPGPLLLGDRRAEVPGSVVAPVMEGRRPLLVELQALACSGGAGPARRSVQGVDPRRLGAVVAVLECRAGIEVGPLELLVSATGGVRVVEPAADLPLALAVASALAGVPCPADLVSCGEVGLAGEIRAVPGTGQRLAEAVRLGFTRAIVPRSAPEGPGGDGGGAGGQRGRGGGRGPPPPAGGGGRRTPDLAGSTAAACGYHASVVDHGGEPLIEALALVAPGTPLRDGLDRILQGKRGALVVMGDDPVVLSICTGGFLLDAEFSPQRLSELAKMDGAIILAQDASRIARANVHLVPRASIPTSETGTRHRTAERVARSIDVPVITVSEAMASVTVFRHARKHTLQPTGRLVARATQAVSTVQRFKTRFDFALATLSTLEVEDAVSVRDVVAVLQPGEMVVRIAEEIAGYLVELGEDGRLIRLQLDELGAGLDESLRLVVLDYVAPPGAARPQRSPADGRPQDGRSQDGRSQDGARDGA
ncbi:MAG: DNA repair protein RadA, partial [Acidimicrobiales bacterium]